MSTVSPSVVNFANKMCLVLAAHFGISLESIDDIIPKQKQRVDKLQQLFNAMCQKQDSLETATEILVTAVKCIEQQEQRNKKVVDSLRPRHFENPNRDVAKDETEFIKIFLALITPTLIAHGATKMGSILEEGLNSKENSAICSIVPLLFSGEQTGMFFSYDSLLSQSIDEIIEIYPPTNNEEVSLHDTLNRTINRSIAEISSIEVTEEVNEIISPELLSRRTICSETIYSTSPDNIFGNSAQTLVQNLTLKSACDKENLFYTPNRTRDNQSYHRAPFTERNYNKNSAFGVKNESRRQTYAPGNTDHVPIRFTPSYVSTLKRKVSNSSSTSNMSPLQSCVSSPRFQRRRIEFLLNEIKKQRFKAIRNKEEYVEREKFLQDEVVELKKKLHEATATVHRVRSTNTDIQAQFEAADDENKRLHWQMENLQGEMQSCKLSHDAMENELYAAYKLYNDKFEEFRNEQAQHSKTTKQLQDIVQELATLENTLLLVKAENNQQSLTISSLTREKEELEQACTHYKESFLTCQRESREQCIKLEHDTTALILELKGQISTLDQQCKELETAKNILIEKEKLQQSLDKGASKELVKAQERASSLKKLLSKVEGALKASLSNNKEKVNERYELQAKVRNYQTKVEELEKKFQKQKLEFDTNRCIIAKLEIDALRLTSDFEAITAAMATSTESHDAAIQIRLQAEQNLEKVGFRFSIGSDVKLDENEYSKDSEKLINQYKNRIEILEQQLLHGAQESARLHKKNKDQLDEKEKQFENFKLFYKKELANVKADKVIAEERAGMAQNDVLRCEQLLLERNEQLDKLRKEIENNKQHEILRLGKADEMICLLKEDCKKLLEQNRADRESLTKDNECLHEVIATERINHLQHQKILDEQLKHFLAEQANRAKRNAIINRNLIKPWWWQTKFDKVPTRLLSETIVSNARIIPSQLYHDEPTSTLMTHNEIAHEVITIAVEKQVLQQDVKHLIKSVPNELIACSENNSKIGAPIERLDDEEFDLPAELNLNLPISLSKMCGGAEALSLNAHEANQDYLPLQQEDPADMKFVTPNRKNRRSFIKKFLYSAKKDQLDQGVEHGEERNKKINTISSNNSSRTTTPQSIKSKSSANVFKLPKMIKRKSKHETVAGK